jgi:hypothetical protein
LFDYERAWEQQAQDSAIPPGAVPYHHDGYSWENDPDRYRRVWWYADLYEEALVYWRSKGLPWQPPPGVRGGRVGRLCGPVECQCVMRWAEWARGKWAHNAIGGVVITVVAGSAAAGEFFAGGFLSIPLWLVVVVYFSWHRRWLTNLYVKYFCRVKRCKPASRSGCHTQDDASESYAERVWITSGHEGRQAKKAACQQGAPAHPLDATDSQRETVSRLPSLQRVWKAHDARRNIPASTGFSPFGTR